MKTIIIDNDSASIDHLEVTLERIGLTTLVGKYTSALEAEQEILRLRPELIVLEPDLIQENGLALAKKMERKINDIKIIFVTSDSNYAVEAFELNQVDFLLKPFKQERMSKALTKLTFNFHKLSKDMTQVICCFKNLHSIELYQDGNVKQIDLKWRTKFAKEIFAYLIMHRDIEVRKDILIEMFWPEIGLKEAFHNLYTSIYFIRKTLKTANLPISIKNHADYYRLDLKEIKLDFEFWFGQVDKYKILKLSQLERNMNLYKGHFLQEESYLWAEHKYQKYRMIWIERKEYLIEQYVKEKNFHRAIVNALEFQRLEPYLEKTYYILMDLFAKTRDFNSVEKQYKKLDKLLKNEYNLKLEKSLNYFMN